MSDAYNLSQAGTLTPEQFAQQQALNRQQQMSQMLLQQSQPAQGQMVSGRYVAPSWAQQLVPLANIMAAKYIGEKADTQAAQLAKQLREGRMAAEESIMNKITGTAGKEGGIYGPNGQLTKETTADMYGPDMQLNPQYKKVAAVAPQKPDIAAALREIRTNEYGAGKDLSPALIEQLIPKDTNEYKNFQRAKSEGFPGNFTQFLDWEANIKRPVTNNIVNMGQRGFENTLKLGEGFKNEPIYKTHQVINQAYNQINSALDKNNAAGDLTAAIKINKLLDPDSIVRESEVATVANATGLIDKLSNYASQVAKGTRLNPEQRKEYRQLAKDFYRISGEQYNETRNKYAEIGRANKLEGVDTMLGKAWSAPVPATPGVTKNMEDANKILGIPSMGGSQ